MQPMNDSPEARVPADAAPSPLVAPAPVAAGLGLLWPVFWVLLLVAVLVAMTVGTGRWLLLSEDGARWLLARLPGVEASGVRGAPLGEALSAERLRVQWAGGSKWLLIEGFQAQGLRWQWRPEKSIWVGLSATHVAARKLELHTGPASPPPKDLLLPLRLILAAAEVDTLVVDGHAVQALKLRRLVIDGRPGQQHGVEHFEFAWDGNAVQGKALLANEAPMALEAQASLVPQAQQGAPPWAAVVNVSGALAQMAVQANLRSVPRAGFATPSLDLHASVLPFAAWPLSELTARTEALDLAALSPQAPQTRLSGSAEILSKALDAPISAHIRIDNARPGRWDQGRVPLRRIELDLGGLLQQRERLTLSRFELQLADDQGAAGRWSGSGVWDGHGLEFSSQLHQVTPQRLDGRAAAMTLSGALNASLKGLPSPDPAAPAPTQALALTWQAALDGRLDAAF